MLQQSNLYNYYYLYILTILYVKAIILYIMYVWIIYIVYIVRHFHSHYIKFTNLQYLECDSKLRMKSTILLKLWVVACVIIVNRRLM